MKIQIPRQAFKEHGLNCHCFRKMKLAEANMIRLSLSKTTRRGSKRFRIGRKWARQFRKWSDKLMTTPPPIGFYL